MISALNKVEFVKVRLSYTVLRDRWCNAIVVKVHASGEERSDVKKRYFL